MFACLFQPSPQQHALFAIAALPRPVHSGSGDARDVRTLAPLEGLAREFSPRVQVHQADMVTLDIAGLGRLLGTPAEIAGELRGSAAVRGLHPHVAVAPTRTAAVLMALGRAGVTVVPPGGERQAVAPLALGVLRHLPRDLAGVLEDPGKNPCGAGVPPAGRKADEVVDLLRRWGLKTLGDLADLPSRPLSERLGQDGVAWQRLARGEDIRPLAATGLDVPIEETVDLEWPVEGLEPLSFVLARLCEPLAERLAALDLAATVLHLSFRLVSRETETRDLQLPAPMRDPKVLRTLILLHLESHPLAGGVDRLALRVDAAPARITQFSLLSRARPFPEQMATLLARLSALLGEDRVGAPALVDSHRPGDFAMVRFSGGSDKPASSADQPVAATEPRLALRRLRLPVPARVFARDERPVRVTTERRGLGGGAVMLAAGPWRTSGAWWKWSDRVEGACPERGARAGRVEGWDRDEWDVALSDGGVYRIFHDRSHDRWFIDGIVD